MKSFRGLLAALLAFGATAALADEAARKPYDPKQAFAETDSNKDGIIDPPEFYERVTESFYLGDADKSGSLDQAEYEAVVVIETNFSAVDRDGDGKVTLIEFFRSRGEVFDQVDSGKDGTLTEAEVVEGFQGDGKPAASGR